jgi:hypothetical protein
MASGGALVYGDDFCLAESRIEPTAIHFAGRMPLLRSIESNDPPFNEQNPVKRSPSSRRGFCCPETPAGERDPDLLREGAIEKLREHLFGD